MKLLFRDYLASLREREELDAILPDLLSELGYTVYSRPQRGTAQAGVDIAAVGNDDDGVRKLFLFTVKQGDLSRQSWDGTPQGLRSSLNEILDVYIPTKIPKRFQKLKIVVCLVFGGDMQEQVRGAVNGYIRKNTSKRISFDEWNGDRLAGLLLEGVLREEIMPKALRSHFQKAVAMVDEPDVAYRHFSHLAHELRRSVQDDKARVRVVRQLYIALWVLFVWARDVENVEAPYRASELVLLNIWNMLRPYIGKRSNRPGRAIMMVLRYAVQLHLTIASELLDKKIFPSVGIRDGISIAVRSHSAVDVNVKLFDVLGRIGLAGLWMNWLIELDPNPHRKAALQEQVSRFAAMGFQLINNNRALFLPLQDQQAIEIALFLVLVGAVNGNVADVQTWLHEMADRLVFTVRTHGRYPSIFTEYRDLVAHPREKTDEYRQEATAGSILIPLLVAFLSALGDRAALEQLAKLKAKELEHCTLQLWMPDQSSEDRLYIGDREHGIALCDLTISETGSELIKIVKEACDQSRDFQELSAVAMGYWPIVLTACRHFRFPVPPQFWIGMLDPPSP